MAGRRRRLRSGRRRGGLGPGADISVVMDDLGSHLVKIVAPEAQAPFIKQTKIGEGTIIMHNVVINAKVEIGKNCIINTKSLVEHDTIIGDHCHVSTGVIINGSCIILSNTFLGTGSVILNNVKCKKKIISAGQIIKN